MEKPAIGIVCATETERDPFLACMSDVREHAHGMLVAYEGRLSGADVFLIFSGIGKVNAAIATQTLIDSFGAGVVVNAGTAGALVEGLDVCDIVVADRSAYHDLDASFMSDSHMTVSPEEWFASDESLLETAREVAASFGRTVGFGCMVTGERFIGEGDHEKLARSLAPLSADMETAAMAHVCKVLGAGFISVRGVTDTPADPGFDVYLRNREAAAAVAERFVEAMVARLSASC